MPRLATEATICHNKKKKEELGSKKLSCIHEEATADDACAIDEMKKRKENVLPLHCVTSTVASVITVQKHTIELYSLI